MQALPKVSYSQVSDASRARELWGQEAVCAHADSHRLIAAKNEAGGLHPGSPVPGSSAERVLKLESEFSTGGTSSQLE